MIGGRESTILNTPDGVYTAHSLGDAEARIYRDGEDGNWDVKVHYDVTGRREAFDVCEDIDRTFEEVYDTVLGVDSIDFNQQLEEEKEVDWRDGNTKMTDKADFYRVSDAATALTFCRYRRPGVELRERGMDEVLDEDIDSRAMYTGAGYRLGAPAAVGAEAVFDVLPHLPAEMMLGAGGIAALLVGEPLLNAKTDLPTPSKVMAQRVVDGVNDRYTMQNEELDAALSRRYTPEGEARWSWDEYEQHGTFDGRNLEEVWETTRFLDFENLETREGVTLTTTRGSYGDALDLVGHLVDAELEPGEAEQSLLQQEVMDRPD